MGTSYNNASIVTNGLVLCLDAANIKSYSGSGTTWSDLSGNSNTGTLTNGPTYSSANGGAIVFDGTNDYSTIATSGFPFGSSAGTLSAWAKTDTISGGNRCIVSYGSNNTSLARLLVIINSTYYFGGYANDITATGVPLNTWFNMVGVYDGTNASMYINGSLVSGPTAKTWNAVASTAQIGRGTYDGEYWDGSISQVSIYNRALSAAEVLQNYNALKDRYPVSIDRTTALTGSSITSSFGVMSPPVVPVTSYLVVAGGGGGARFSGGGGAGGLLSGTSNLTVGTTYTVTVGAGGVGGSGAVDSTYTWGGTGGNSSFNSIIAYGGGGGASRGASYVGVAGNPGGSGGGASPADNNPKTGGAATPAGQGNKGGDKITTFGWGGAGGGGAGAAGANSTGNVAGNGGIGIQSSISGVATYYGGGGGGSSYSGNTVGVGGLGGGGAGKSDQSSVGDSGTTNTGGGGGGGAYSIYNGGSGGSGVVIISSTLTATATTGSPTVTTSGSNTIYKFTTSGTITF